MNIDEEAATAVTVTHIEYDGYYVLINGLLHSSMPRFEYEESAEKLAAYLRLTLAAFARRCAKDMRERCEDVARDHACEGPPECCPCQSSIAREISRLEVK